MADGDLLNFQSRFTGPEIDAAVEMVLRHYVKDIEPGSIIFADDLPEDEILVSLAPDSEDPRMRSFNITFPNFWKKQVEILTNELNIMEAVLNELYTVGVN